MIVLEEGTDITIYFDGERIVTSPFNFLHPMPRMENHRILAPLRATFEQIGADVSWAPTRQEVVIEYDVHTVTVRIGSVALSSITRITGNPNIPVRHTRHTFYDGVYPRMIYNRTFLPLRSTALAIGYDVDWNDRRQRATIVTPVAPTGFGARSNQNIIGNPVIEEFSVGNIQWR